MFKIDLFKRKEGEGTKKVFKCKYCGLQFEEKERLSRHTRKAHSEKGGSDIPNRNPFGF